MKSTMNNSAPRKLFGLTMIAAGIYCGAVQLARAAAVRTGAAQATAAGMPRIENAKVESRSITGNLEATFRELLSHSDKPQWLGYGVDQIAGEGGVCCDNYRSDAGCGTCRLENEHGETRGTTTSSGSVKLEGARQLLVLFRLDGKQIQRIRVASDDCALDAGALPFIWLTGVKSPDSLALLTSYVHGADFELHHDHGIGHGALTAIALHADAAADRALGSFARPEQPDGLRRQAAFWMGAARGKAGLVSLQRMAKTDPSSDVRAQVAFALSVSHEPAAIDEMIRMAHDDTSTHVRGQALFWLAQRAGKKAVGTITAAIENDPDTEVKKKAVFALSQLPKDEGVPKLIEVAQTNRNPYVRKQAMFWLGQSNDPRALQFFEKVLSQ